MQKGSKEIKLEIREQSNEGTDRRPEDPENPDENKKLEVTIPYTKAHLDSISDQKSSKEAISNSNFENEVLLAEPMSIELYPSMILYLKQISGLLKEGDITLQKDQEEIEVGDFQLIATYRKEEKLFLQPGIDRLIYTLKAVDTKMTIPFKFSIIGSQNYPIVRILLNVPTH